jgi:hypothetical protein
MPDGGVDLLMGVNETVFDTLAPLTDMEPDDDETEYPDIFPIVYEYVPFGSENDITSVVDENFCPLDKLTYQVVPDCNPVSVNVTVYRTLLNVTDSDTDAPLTVNDPE